MLKCFDKVNCEDLFVISTSNLRGHGLKLFKNRFRTDVGKFSFGNRTVEEWNLLTDEIVSCNTVEQFKSKLDHYFMYCRGFI